MAGRSQYAVIVYSQPSVWDRSLPSITFSLRVAQSGVVFQSSIPSKILPQGTRTETSWHVDVLWPWLYTGMEGAMKPDLSTWIQSLVLWVIRIWNCKLGCRECVSCFKECNNTQLSWQAVTFPQKTKAQRPFCSAIFCQAALSVFLFPKRRVLLWHEQGVQSRSYIMTDNIIAWQRLTQHL